MSLTETDSLAVLKCQWLLYCFVCKSFRYLKDSLSLLMKMQWWVWVSALSLRECLERSPWELQVSMEYPLNYNCSESQRDAFFIWMTFYHHHWKSREFCVSEVWTREQLRVKRCSWLSRSLVTLFFLFVSGQESSSLRHFSHTLCISDSIDGDLLFTWKERFQRNSSPSFRCYLPSVIEFMNREYVFKTLAVFNAFWKGFRRETLVLLRLLPLE
jgi:hypothetical protein